MREGLWLVSDQCQGFIRAAQSYTGKEADLKDKIDAPRYAVADILLDPLAQIETPRPRMTTL